MISDLYDPITETHKIVSEAVHRTRDEQYEEFIRCLSKHGFSEDFVNKHSEEFHVETEEVHNIWGDTNLYVTYFYHLSTLLFSITSGYIIEGTTIKIIWKITDLK